MSVPGAQVFAPGQNGYTIPNKPKDWFSYPISFPTLVINVPQSQNIAIDAGSDFFLTAIEVVATVTSTAVSSTATRVLPLVKMLLTDSGSNRQLMQNPVDVDSLTGTGQLPHRLIHPRLFMRNSNIQVVVQSYDVNNTYLTFNLNFEGFRIYT